MSIQYMEGFSIYGGDETAMVANSAWSTVSSSTLVSDPDGVSSGTVLNVDSSTSNQPTFVVPTATDVCNILFRWWCTSLPVSSSEGHDVEIRDSNGDIRYILRVTPTGALELVRTDGAGTRIDSADVSGFTIVDTSSNVITSGVWQHIEWSMDRTSGDYEVFVEGVSVMSGTDGSVATGNTGLVTWRTEWLSSANANQDNYIKDFIFADDGGSVNNGTIGTVQVITRAVNADVSSGWTRSSGSTDYELLDETGPNDTDYIEAEDDPLPAPSIMEFGNLTADIVGIRALQTMVRALKTDGGDATMVVSLTSNGSDDDGQTHAVATSAQYYWDISELDPDTAALWTPLAVDAAYIQIDRTL